MGITYLNAPTADDYNLAPPRFLERLTSIMEHRDNQAGLLYASVEAGNTTETLEIGLIQ